MASPLEQQLSDKIADMSETISALRAQAGMEKSLRQVAEQKSSELSAENHLLRSENDEYQSSRSLNKASDNLQTKTSTNRYSLAGGSAARAGKESTQKEESGPTSTPEYS